MEFDVYCTPPLAKEIEEYRGKLKSKRKKAIFLSIVFLALWAAGIWHLWSLQFADQRIILGIGGAMLGLVILTRIIIGARAAVGLAVCLLAALASTVSTLWWLTRQNDMAIAIYSGLGSGALVGVIGLLVGNMLRVAQAGLRTLKPVSEKKKAHAEILQLCAKHQVLERYRSRAGLAGRPLLRGEITAMKAWSKKAGRLIPVPVPEPEPRHVPEEPQAAAEQPEPVESVEFVEPVETGETVETVENVETVEATVVEPEEVSSETEVKEAEVKETEVVEEAEEAEEVEVAEEKTGEKDTKRPEEG